MMHGGAILVSKKFWEKPILEFINLISGVKEKKTINILGVNFLVFPGVFSPIYASDTAWFAEKIIPLVKNKKFLEIGSGSGIIACLAALQGAIHVTATDINTKAIDNIQENVKLHSLNISIREGSVFNPIQKGELFDLIFWNHPFYFTDQISSSNDMLTASVCDNKYQSLSLFFHEGKKHLTKDGLLILGTSNVARINVIKKLAHDAGYTMNLLEKTIVPIFKGKKVKMDLRVYSFKLV